MKTNRLIIIALIALVAIVSIGSCSAGLFDFLGGSSDVGTITINCEGANESGELMIIEFKDIQQNENGTYNTSQFGYDNGTWKGDVVYIPIENGTAEYNLTEGTQMFAVDNYILNLTEEYEFADDSTPEFEVKYLYNGNETLKSSEHAYADQCDVSFGGNIYFINGTGFTDDNLNIDLPNLQESYDNVMELFG